MSSGDVPFDTPVKISTPKEIKATLGDLIKSPASGGVVMTERTPGPTIEELHQLKVKLIRRRKKEKEQAKQDVIDARVTFMEMPLEERLKRTALYDMVLMLGLIEEQKVEEEAEFAEIEELAELEELGSGGWS